MSLIRKYSTREACSIIENVRKTGLLKVTETKYVRTFAKKVVDKRTKSGYAYHSPVIMQLDKINGTYFY